MNTTPCPRRWPRRRVLQLGGLALGGMTLPELFAAREASGTRAADTSVIMLYLHGGPSQLETYDLKPLAPQEYRSIYAPIATCVPGIEICEKFPLQAQQAHRFSLVRSVHHEVGIHSDGGIVMLTGKVPTTLDPTSRSVSEHPDYGSVASRTRGLGPDGIPPYIAIPQALYMTRPAYAGAQHAAFVVGDPSSSGYRHPLSGMAASRGRPGQIAERERLLAALDRLEGDLDQRGGLTSRDEFHRLALEMLSSRRVAEAFDLEQETPALRDRYGRHRWGQSCLLARRLAERGAAVVSLYIDTPKSGPEYTNWDDHIANAGRPGHFGIYMDRRLPFLDQALSALIDDVFTRGLSERILVLVMGEFGRTPRLSQNATGTGRDHWPQASTVLLSGGGLKMGQVVGSTNAKAEFPVSRPVTPADLLATVYRHLGIDRNAVLLDSAGRPQTILSTGEPIAELL